MEIIEQFDLSTSNWIWLMICAVCVGMAKTGLGGLGMLVVPVMAGIFGPRESTGILLPMLIFADVGAVLYYHQHADMRLLIKLAPATIAGVIVAIYVGDIINNEQFGILLAAIILIGLAIMIWRELAKSKAVPHTWTFSSLAGLLGGFTTMIANAAGPVISIYFLSLNLKKNSFIGTGAWFFLLVNIFKVPFHIAIWETIYLDTFLFNLFTIPAIAAGAILGIKIVKVIPEKPYRFIVIASAGLAALKLFS